MSGDRMTDLYDIMDDFLQSEFDVKALKDVVTMLEDTYRQSDQTDAEEIAHVIKGYLEKTERSLHTAIGKLDQYLVTNSHCRQGEDA